MAVPWSPKVGLQYIGFDDESDLDEVRRRSVYLLARSLNTRRVVAVIGSGVSANYGYPRWEDLTRAVAKRVRTKLPDDRVGAFDEARKSALAGAGRMKLSRADRLTGLLDLCQREWHSHAKHLGSFHDLVLEMLDRKTGSRTSDDPLANLISDLRITRFLTSNYDDLIEDELRAHGHDARWLALEGSEPEDLVAFALGTESYRTGVLHLHGRKPDAATPDASGGPLVVTEKDYQRLYVRTDEEYRTRREALSLAFTANPILFVGMGLDEPDLLRPLRELATERRDLRERPLFALLAAPERPAEAAQLWRFLYARYGIKTIFYRAREDASEGESLCAAIRDVGEAWRGWWNDWQLKPPVRRPAFGIVSDGEREAMVRHNTKAPDNFFVGPDQLKVVTDRLGAGRRVVLGVGRPGMGKGGLGKSLALTGDVTLEPEGKRFSATLHFSNDFLSVIDAAADHLGGAATGEMRAQTDPFTRLHKALTEGNHLFVLGGVERLLEPVSPPLPAPAVDDDANGGKREPDSDNKPFLNAVATAAGELYPTELGRPATREGERFVAMIKDLIASPPGTRSHVVLTTSVVPKPLADVYDGSSTDGLPHGVDLVGAGLDELTTKLELLGVGGDRAERLHRALRGHAYLLWIVAAALADPDAGGQNAVWADRLIARLTSIDLTHRASATVGAALEALLDPTVDTETSGDIHAVLTLLSLFSTPVGEPEIRIAAGLQHRADNLLRRLADRQLILEVQGDSKDSPRFTAHTVVRGYYIERLGNSLDPVAEVHRFELSGYSIDVPETQSLSEKGHKFAAAAVERLLDAAEDQVRAGVAETAVTPVARLVRAAFGIVRARWTATGVGRLWTEDVSTADPSEPSQHEAYMTILVRLLNVALALGERQGAESWSSETQDRAVIERPLDAGGVLYADELAWLYNELALGSFCRGALYDAYALYRMCQDVNSVAERSTPGERWCESEIGLGVVATERGRLQRARAHLEHALRVATRYRGRQLQARAAGHLGLVHHLTGDYPAAARHYEVAISILQEVGNRRGLSIFLRHYGDLLRWERDFVKAESKIRESIAAAESGQHHDLLQHARVAQANLEVARAVESGEGSRHARPSLQRLHSVVQYARSAGLPKLEVSASLVQANLALSQGDIALASRRVHRCLSLVSLYRMNLQMTGALVMLGRVTMAMGDVEGAKRLVRTAKRMGEQQGYQLQVEHTERLLMELYRAHT